MKTKLILSLLTAAVLTACGGGGGGTDNVNASNAATLALTGGGGSGGTELRVTRQSTTSTASTATASQTQAIQYYQALTGKAPSYNELGLFVSNFSTGDIRSVYSYMDIVMRRNGIDVMTDTQLAALVLKNLNISATTLNSTAQFGTSAVMYANLEAAVADYFNATGKANRAVVISQLAGIVAGMENETTFGVYGNAAVGFNKQVAANYVYSSNTANYVSAVVAVIEKLPPIPVQASSYLNAKNINMAPQWMPTAANSIGWVADEAITAGHAYGDFFQNGAYSMVAASNIFAGRNGQPSTVAGRIYFYQKDGAGNWVDKSSELVGLNDRTGCISPRKVIVADFNGDKKPDIFIACYGLDGDTPAGYTAGQGEKPRYLLSQPDGKYKNFAANDVCKCHSAAAADFNGTGYADIVVTDAAIAKTPYYLVNNKNGTFTADFTRMHAEVGPFSFPNQTNTHGRQYYTVELFDVNNDGKFDMFLNGSETFDWPAREYNNPSTIYHNTGSNKFNSTFVRIPTSLSFPVNASVNDVIFKDGKLAMLNIGSTWNSVEVVVYSLTTNTTLRSVPVTLRDTPWFTIYNGSVVSSFALAPYTIAF
jgi:hypothetical protein